MRTSATLIFLMVPFLGLFFDACGYFCNDCDEPIVYYRYVDSTAYDLTIQRFEKEKPIFDPLVISNGDSVEVESNWLNKSEAESNKYLLRFHSIPESCLVFTGKIQNNKLDIRGDIYPGFLSNEKRYVYRVKIDSTHFRAASPCLTSTQFQQ